MHEPIDLAAALRDALAALDQGACELDVALLDDGSLTVTRRQFGPLVNGERELESTSEATFAPVSSEGVSAERVRAWVEAWIEAREKFTSMDEATPALLRRRELETKEDFARAFADWEFCTLVGSAEEPDPSATPEEQLQAAIESADFVRVGDLLDEQPSLATSRDDVGFTPLHVAAERCSVALLPTAAVRVIELLLARGADPEAANDDGIRPLHLARKAAVAPLMRAGAHLEARDGEGRTPLIVQAQEEEGLPALAALLAAGAARDARDNQGLSAEDHARARGETDKLEALG